MDTKQGLPTGVVQRRRARSSGTTVEIIDTDEETTFDSAGGRWVTICEHGYLCNHQTRVLAGSFAAAPEEWCELCDRAANQRSGR